MIDHPVSAFHSGPSSLPIRASSKKYFVVYEPGGRLPGSQPPSMHLWTQPRILACWLACCCSPPPLAPPPKALSAKTRSVPSSPTTSSVVHAFRLLTLVMPIFPSPHCCRIEFLMIRRPP